MTRVKCSWVLAGSRHREKSFEHKITVLFCVIWSLRWNSVSFQTTRHLRPIGSYSCEVFSWQNTHFRWLLLQKRFPLEQIAGCTIGNKLVCFVKTNTQIQGMSVSTAISESDFCIFSFFPFSQLLSCSWGDRQIPSFCSKYCEIKSCCFSVFIFYKMLFSSVLAINNLLSTYYVLGFGIFKLN